MLGQTIFHYKILEKLGGGGMGVVYKALDTKLDRFAALKFLPQHLSKDEADKQRFIHEAKAASALDHPNICNIHEINETKDGQLFIAMAYYEGETLQQKVSSNQLSVNSAIDIVIQIAQGLAKAHEHGITHRDLKPANVIITKEGVAKIVDFGLAKFAGLSKLTKTGTTLGTVAYMSPEQARGEEVDHHTDIWALGVVLYEMLTGQLPFKGEYEHVVMYSILNEEPKPMTELRSGVPMALEQIADKALTKSSGKRYQNMNDMLTALKTLKQELEFGNAKARPLIAKLRRKKRFILYTGLAGLLVVLMEIGLYLNQRLKQEAKINSIAVLPLANLSGDASQEFFADGITEALISVLGQTQALRVISRTSVMQYKGGTKPLPVIAQELNVDAIVEGSATTTGDRVSITVRLIEARTEKRLWSQSFERELRDVLTLQREVALAITRKIEVQVTQQEETHLPEARVVDPEAYKLYLWGLNLCSRETPESIQQAVNHFEQAIKIDPDFAQAYAASAVPYYMLRLFSLMPKDVARAKAKQAAAKALELDATLSEAHAAMGVLRHIYDWDWSGAEEEFRYAITLNPGNAEAHRQYAWFLCRRGRGEEGLAEIMRALELDPLSETVNASAAWIYIYNRQYDKAIEHCRNVLQLNPHFAFVQYFLGLAYLAKGHYDEAIAVYESEAIVAFGRGAPDYWGFLGCAYAWSGKREKALKLLAELKKLWEQGDNVGIFIALIYARIGEKDKALDMIEWESRQGESIPFSDYLLHPFFDSLHSEARFQALLKKMGLEK